MAANLCSAINYLLTDQEGPIRGAFCHTASTKEKVENHSLAQKLLDRWYAEKSGSSDK